MADDRDRRRSEQDASIDAALDAVANGAPTKPAGEISFKRQWDADLDAELEAAMAGFDESAFEAGSPKRLPREDRAGGMAPRGGRGQETRSGPQVGKVISVRGKSVFVDLGAKSEGVVPVDQFNGDLPSPGDSIEVRVDHFDTDEGILILSLKGAAVEASWENLRKGLIVEARVTKTNKGGLDVEVDGIRGFLPIGQIDINRVEDASIYVNQKLRVVVTEANQREKNLVVSRRELLEQERAEKREETWKTLEEGQVHKGVVRTIKAFGAFVEIGGVDGLIHVGDMAWSRVSDPSTLLKPGDEVEVKVLKIDRVTQKVGLGLKQLMPSPWDRVDEKYHRGQMVKGKVTRGDGFWRVRRARTGHRGADPHLRAFAQQGPPGDRHRQARARRRGPDRQDRSRGEEDGPVVDPPPGRLARRRGGGRRRDAQAAQARAQGPPQGRPGRP